MKKLILLFGICLVLFNCNNDDKPQPEPIIIEEEPDLSFPTCLLSEDIFEYMIIMTEEPTESRGELIKVKYEGEYYYAFNQYNMIDYPVTFYNNDCEVYCISYPWGHAETDCSYEFKYGLVGIGVVWTDPR